MQVFLVNPSNVSFGIAVITPRWLFVLAGGTPEKFGTPVLVDETLERMDLSHVKPGDIVGVSVHTGNALRGYEVGKAAARPAPRSFTAAFTRRCIRTKPASRARATRSSAATAT